MTSSSHLISQLVPLLSLPDSNSCFVFVLNYYIQFDLSLSFNTNDLEDPAANQWQLSSNSAGLTRLSV